MQNCFFSSNKECTELVDLKQLHPLNANFDYCPMLITIEGLFSLSVSDFPWETLLYTSCHSDSFIQFEITVFELLYVTFIFIVFTKALLTKYL